MNNIHFLIHLLTKPQIKLFKIYLQYFSVRKEADTQLMRLTEILLEAKEEIPSIEDCSRLLYGKWNYNGIQKLKSRLQKKIENLLLLDSGTEKRNEGQDDIDKYGVIVRRNATLFQIYATKTGGHNFLEKKINDVIRMARKYEHYTTLIDMLKFKKWSIGFRQGEKFIHNMNEEIAFYERCSNTLNKAVDCYYIGMIRSDFGVNKILKRSQLSFLQDNITFLKKEIVVTKSPLVTYYSKYLEVMYHDKVGNVEAMRDICLELITVISQNKSVYRKQRIAIVYDYLANCDIHLGDYDQGIENARLAQKKFIKPSFNYYAAVEIEFQANFYKEDMDRCKSLCTTLLKSDSRESGEFRFAKYVFFQANIYYKQEKYTEALRLLNNKLKLSTDKLGWDIGIRILKIQTLIALERLEEASSNVMSLLKHAKRASVLEELKPRQKLIMRILRMLYKEGFSGTRIRTKLVKYFGLLHSHADYEWKPVSSELIPFDLWLANRYKLSRKKGILMKN